VKRRPLRSLLRALAWGAGILLLVALAVVILVFP